MWDKKNCLGGTVWALLQAVPGCGEEVAQEEGESWTTQGKGRSVIGDRWNQHRGSVRLGLR